MKCKSLTCIWSGSPPVQRVTAAVALDEPPTLYTGGSDGSIIWWNLVSSLEKTEMIPVAMLCGHAASIVDLGICSPLEGPELKLSNSSTVLSHPNAINSRALISACSDGVLCVWSRKSGHCRRRRKIPPWAGSPFMIRTLPKNRRYVCITCCSVTPEHQLINSIEGGESSVDTESQNVKNVSKCTVIIIDSFTLTIVQTVFHGNVSVGPFKSMALVLPSGDTELQSVMIIDSYGKVLDLPIVEDQEPKRQNMPVVPKDSSFPKVVDWGDHSKEKGSLVAFAKCGCVLALVHRTHCTFRQTNSGTVFGNISFSDNQLCLEGTLYVIGGIFLGDDIGISSSGFAAEFVAWNNRGTAVIYRISYSNSIFEIDPLSVIPAVSYPSHIRLSFCFVPLSKYTIRVASIGFHAMEHMFWRPHITIWLSPMQKDSYGNRCSECEMIGEGIIGNDWAIGSSLSKNEDPNHDIDEEGISVINEMTTSQNSIQSPGETDGDNSTGRDGAYSGRQLVSSSMVISGNYMAPYAIVYGYFNGDIDIVRFQVLCTALDTVNKSPFQESDSYGHKHHLSGHSGAVLCLASHQMVSRSEGCCLNHVLLSGSMDCTVRVWDLDSGNPITVLHHHVAPVRQIILPPCPSEHPWCDCFLTVGSDSCVALASLQTLRVERLFPGHLYFPANVVWDGVRGYIACLCLNHSENSDATDMLYIWDVKTGARERVLRGAAAHSMFDHFLKVVNETVLPGKLMNGSTSASSLVFPVIEEGKFPQSHTKASGNGFSAQQSTASKIDASETSNTLKRTGVNPGISSSLVFRSGKRPIESSCPFPGVSTLCFDLSSLMSLCSKNELSKGSSHIEERNDVKGSGCSTPRDDNYQKEKSHVKELGPEIPIHQHVNGKRDQVSDKSSVVAVDHHEWDHSIEGCLLQFSLSFLHLWKVDNELDNLLITEMKLKQPDPFIVSSGILGDRGSMTLTFPVFNSTLELWRSSSEYSALRSLTIVSLAQHLISLSHSCSSASSALAAFYTRKFAEKIVDIKPPLLQILVSFWQNEFEHVKMAARSLFHCAASRAIPLPLCSSKADQHVNFHLYPYGFSDGKHENTTALSPMSDGKGQAQDDSFEEESEITSWLESYEVQDWITCVGGTTQDAMTSQILVAAALAVWYPSLVKPRLAMVVVHQLVKLVMSMNDKYSAAAAEILAEGMESTWKTCIGSDVPRLIGDIFFQVECVSGTSANPSAQNSAASLNIRETLVGILLPSLAMADIPGFLHVIESQIWSTASDSPVHVVSLLTLIRVIRGSPRNLAPHLEKVVIFILQTMDPGNSTMRKTCLQSSMTALKEVLRVFPMIALNDTSTRLAVGDAIGDISNSMIRVYDMQSMSKIKVLDASGPPGLPNLLGGSLEMTINTAISALSFSPDGEGLVAFSENGLMIRWWSLGSVWWEKLGRNLVPVQCTKLIFVPPWEGFSPNSTRSSIMASVLHDDRHANSPGSTKSSSEMDRLKLLIHNLDLSYRLEWVGERKVRLTQHSRELGIFQL